MPKQLTTAKMVSKYTWHPIFKALVESSESAAFHKRANITPLPVLSYNANTS